MDVLVYIVAAYLGVISSLEDLPSVTGLNNYFTWGGAETVSALSITGKFTPATTYKFIGTNKAWKWEIDDDLGHGVIAMSDILGIAGADLEHNNSQAWEYLNHLTSNSVYTDLLIANNAFINNLTARVITAGDLITVGQAEDITDDALDEYMTATGITRDYTVIQNGKIVTGLLDASDVWAKIVIAKSATFENITVTGTSTFSGTVNAKGGTFTGEEVINGSLQLNGIMKSIFPVLKVEKAQCYHINYQHFIDTMVDWINSINNIGLHISSFTYPNVYFKASGRFLWNDHSGNILFVRLVVENGQLANDKFTIYVWDEVAETMVIAVKRVSQMTSDKYEIFNVTPNSLGTYDFNVSSNSQGIFSCSGAISIL